MYELIVGRIGNQTTYASTLEAEGKRLFGSQFAGVFARDTMPTVQSTPTAYVVNIDHSTGSGVHWVAALDSNGQRYYNDPLGHYGKQQRAELERLQPYQFAEDDAEQLPSQKDCGVRALVALAIGLSCGPHYFLEL